MTSKIDAIAEIYQGDADPDDWVVWAADPTGDGGTYITIFSGIEAERRATAYAHENFREFLRRDPDQQRYQ
jgi:hypothetical protein